MLLGMKVGKKPLWRISGSFYYKSVILHFKGTPEKNPVCISKETYFYKNSVH